MPSIKRELSEYGLFPQKSLGQHFLIDRGVLDRVIQTAEVNAKDVVLEVGPGLGEMTLRLARLAKRVIAVEIDAKLVEALKKKLSHVPNVEIIRGDILKIDFEDLFQRAGKPLKVVANLPYQISTPLLFRFIESKKYFSSLTLMLQKEVVERMVASPGVKAYGSLSVFVQMVSIPSIQFYVEPSAFFPPPKVESAVVQIFWRSDWMIPPEEEEWFKKVVRASFSHRRKTLINSLKHSGLPLPSIPEERITTAGIDPKRRPETLTLQEFVLLSEVLKK